MIFLDLETTGFDPKKDKIIEFAAVKVDSDFNVIETKDFVCNPGVRVSKTVLNLTGISQEEIDGGLDFDQKINEIKDFLSTDQIIGHNIKFDISFLNEKGLALECSSIDTCVLANIFLPGHESYALEVLSDVLDIDHEFKHRALGDVMACVEITKIVIGELQNCSNDFINEINGYSYDGVYKDFINTFKENPQTERCKLAVLPEPEMPPMNAGVEWNQQYFEWNSLDRLVQKVYQFLNSDTSESGAVAIMPNFAYKNVTRYFRSNPDINIVESPENEITLQDVDDYIGSHGVNKDNEGLLLKIIYSKHLGLPLNKSFINIAYDDNLIWDKYFAGKHRNLTIKRKNIVSFSTWKKHKDIFEGKELLFIDPDLGEEDRASFVSENALLNVFSEEGNLIQESLQLIKNELTSNFDMGTYGITYEIGQHSEIDPVFQLVKEELTKIRNAIEKKDLTGRYAKVLDNFFGSDEHYSYVYLNPDNKVTIYSLKLNLLEGLSDDFARASFGFFAGMLNGGMSFQSELFDIQIPESESDLHKAIKISHSDLNSPGGKHPDFTQFSYDKIKELVSQNTGKNIAILSNSKKNTEDLSLYLNENFEGLTIVGVGLSGGINKAIHKANHLEGIVVIGNIDFFLRYMMSGSKSFDLGIISRLPFDNPGGINKKRSAKFHNSFTDYSLPKSTLKVKQFALSTGADEIFFVDNRVVKDGWARGYAYNLSLLAMR